VAFKEKAALMQDLYYDIVGAPSGLSRFGRRRQRLSREAWLAQREQAKAMTAYAERVAKRDAAFDEEVRTLARPLARDEVAIKIAEITTTKASPRRADDLNDRLDARLRSFEERLRIAEQENDRLRAVLRDNGRDPDESSTLAPR
jgi:hypothetical protein